MFLARLMDSLGGSTMFHHSDDLRQYKIGYFSRKHKLDRNSAKLILAVSPSSQGANRRARQVKRVGRV